MSKLSLADKMIDVGDMVNTLINRHFLVAVITSILMVGCSQVKNIPKYENSIDSYTANILDACQDKKLILLGEKHKRPNSQQLFTSLVKSLVDNNSTIFVGLEIPNDQQESLNQLAAGTSLSNPSFIPSVIDHPSYRQMIRELGDLTQYKVTIRAVDAADNETDRDGKMLENLLSVYESGQYDKIVVLVGNLHAIKQIMWHPDVGHQNQYLGGKLIENGIEVCSIMQLFSDHNDQSGFYESSTAEGASKSMDAIKAVYYHDEMSGNNASDAVIVW